MSIFGRPWLKPRIDGLETAWRKEAHRIDALRYKIDAKTRLERFALYGASTYELVDVVEAILTHLELDLSVEPERTVLVSTKAGKKGA